jgi:hypothetical protein
VRIGVLVVGLLLLGSLFVAGTTLIRRHGAPPTPAPTPSASEQAYFLHSDPQHEYSIMRPEGWNTRNLATANPNIVLVVGPDPPFPVDDVVTVQIHPLGRSYPATALLPFRDFIVQTLGSNVNLVTQEPSPIIDGLVGYYFVWTFPATSPQGLHAAYFLLDGDRYITILLQVQPATDTTSFTAMQPVFQHMAQTFKSFHHAATPSASPSS